MITLTFIVVMVVFSLICLNSREAMTKYLFHPYSIYHGREHYRFLTHAFIHGDYFHLLFNCLALYSFGLMLEEGYFGNEHFFDPRIGKVFYILLFTGGIYAASLAEYFRNRNEPSYSSLGASGAISAVIFSFIMVSPTSRIAFFFIPMRGWVFGLLLLGISFYLIQRKRMGNYRDNISHESHFWGAIFGVVFTIATKPSIIFRFISEIM